MKYPPPATRRAKNVDIIMPRFACLSSFMPKYFCIICGSPHVPKLVISTVAMSEVADLNPSFGSPSAELAYSLRPSIPPTLSQRMTKIIRRVIPNIITMP